MIFVGNKLTHLHSAKKMELRFFKKSSKVFFMDNPTVLNEKNEDENVISLLEIQEAINSRLKRLEILKDELKPVKEMLDSIFINDTDYVEKNEIAKKASKNKSEAKKRILRQPQVSELNQKIEDMKGQLKEVQESLSYYLREYQRLTGANEFEGEDGEIRQIVYVAKLVRKTNLNDGE